MEYKSKQRFMKFDNMDDVDEFGEQYALSMQLVRSVTGNNYGVIQNRIEQAMEAIRDAEDMQELLSELAQMDRDNLYSTGLERDGASTGISQSEIF